MEVSDPKKIKNILIVEDNEELATIYSNWLEDGEYTVDIAHSSSECLEKLSDKTDLIFLDRRLPRTTGGELLDRIGAKGYETAVVLITRLRPDIEIVQRSFDGYLEKPITEVELIQTVQTIDDRSEYNETIREWVKIQNKISLLEDVMSEKRQENSTFLQELYSYCNELEEEIGNKNQEITGLFVTPHRIGVE